MSIESHDSQVPPAGKRKRNENDMEPPTASTSNLEISPSQLAANLRTTSPDSLRQSLSSLRRATQVEHDETLIAPNDKRLGFARDFLANKGLDRIYEAWTRIDDMKIPSLQLQPLLALSNLIRLTSAHFTDHDLCLALIRPMLPQGTGEASTATHYWQILATYLTGMQSANVRHAHQQVKGDDTLIASCLQLLANTVRFQSGRFARTIVEHFPWNSKVVIKLSTLRRKQAKGAKGRSDATARTASLSKPDSRIHFLLFLASILHPALLPSYEPDDGDDNIDSGAATSTKLLLLGPEYGLSHLSTFIKSLVDDHTSTAARLLHVLERSIVRDGKLPRGALVSLVRSSDILVILLQLGSKSQHQLHELSTQLLRQLCGRSGRGVCFHDRGWYGRTTSGAPTSANSGLLEEPIALDTLEGNALKVPANSSGIFNPLLDSFIVSAHFSPLYNTTHRELLLQILSAATELQPVYLSSSRGAFGGGRLEPPASGTLPDGTKPSVRDGARLSGLLANRLMGQLLALDLPRFQSRIAPSMSHLMAGLLPPTILRSNLMKGIRHHDRLVRWSTLDLLQRILARALKFQSACQTFTLQNQMWAAACKSVFKEFAKRLPDVSTVLSSLELDDRKKHNEDESASAVVDHIMVEATLRAASLLSEVLIFNHAAPSPLNFDIGKLLRLAGLSHSHEPGGLDDDGAVELRASIQLHSLRILRLSKAQILHSSSTGGTQGMSSFTSLVVLFRSPDTEQEIKSEALQLLTETVGAVAGPENFSGIETMTQSLLFEGDYGELEAWLAALPSTKDYALPTTLGVVTLLEECLVRCSRNTYRYLELARKAQYGDNSAAEGGLSVSPLFTTLLEQMTIKLQKDLFVSQDLKEAVLQYLVRLVALLCGRGRAGIPETLSRLLTQMTSDLSGRLSDGESWMLQVATEVTVSLDNASDQSINPIQAQRTKKIAPAKHSSYTFENLLISHERPVTRSNLTALTVSIDEHKNNSSIGTSLLLLNPATENLMPSIEELLQTHEKISIPTSILLLHSLNVHVDKAILDRIDLIHETAPLAKLSLRLVLVKLAKGSGDQTAMALRVLAHIASSSALTSRDLGELFFRSPILLASLEKGITDIVPLVKIAKNIFDSSNATERRYTKVLVQFLLARLDSSTDIAVELLSYMEETQLQRIWATLASLLPFCQTDGQIISSCDLMRKVWRLISLDSDQPESNFLEQTYALLARQSHNKATRDSIAALLYELLRVDGLDGFKSPDVASRQGRLRRVLSDDGLLSYPLEGDFTGKDALQASLIYRCPAAADRLLAAWAEKATSNTAQSMPMSLRAVMDTKQSIVHSDLALPAPLVTQLQELCFSRTQSVGQISSDCLGALCKISKIDDVLSVFPTELLPGKAFQLGAISFAAALAEKGERSDHVCRAVDWVLDQGLLWLVRRFAEDDEDKEELLVAIEAFTALVHYAATNNLTQPKPYLAEPVIEAGIKRRLTERRPMELVRALLRHTSLPAKSASSLLSTMMAHSQFSALVGVSSSSNSEGDGATEPVGRLIIVSSVYYLATQHPVQMLTAQTVQALLSIYGGTLTLSDRLIFNLLEQAEQHNPRISLTSLISAWSADGTAASSSAPLALDALLSLQPSRAFNTCASFPRARDFTHLDMIGGPSTKEESGKPNRLGRDQYDPLLILSILAAALNDDNRITGLQWLSILRTSAVGVAVCALSSKSVSVRQLALMIMQKVYASIQSSNLQEREHILLALDSVRNSLIAPEEGSRDPLAPLPLTSTLFFAHHFRLLASPSSIFYPVSSRFLLQRPTFDTSDVPMLYNMLQSTDAEHWRAHRLWMLRFLRDTLIAGGDNLEWKVMKRRYTWDLLASIYTGAKNALSATLEGVDAPASGPGQEGSSSAVTLRQCLALTEEVMLAAITVPTIAAELIVRKAFLGWILQQVVVGRLPIKAGDDDHDIETVGIDNTGLHHRNIWLLLLHNSLKTASTDKIDRSTAGTWVSSTLDIVEEIKPSSAIDCQTAIEIVVLIVEHLLSKSEEEGATESLSWLADRITSLLERLASTIPADSLEPSLLLLECFSHLERISTDHAGDRTVLLSSKFESMRSKLLEVVLSASTKDASAKIIKQRESLRRGEVAKLQSASPL